MQTPLRAVLFDLDGTLVDNMAWHVEAWIEAAAALGHAITAARVMRDFAGRRNEEIFPMLLGRPVPPDELARLAEEKEARYRAVYAPHLRPASGAAALLDELASAGVVCGIASAAPRDNRELVLRGLGWAERFAAVVGAEQVRRGKPAPDLFLAGAAALGVDPAAVLVFEDAALGVEAARAAGMTVCGLTTGEPADVLLRAGAIAVAPDFVSLPSSVTALWRAPSEK